MVAKASEAGAPETRFQTSTAQQQGAYAGFMYHTTDGKRFLIQTTGADAPEQPLTVVVNWLAAAKK